MQYNQNEKMIIWLHFFDFLTIEKRKIILSAYDEPSEIFEQFQYDYNLFSKIITKSKFDIMVSSLNKEFIENEIVSLDRQKIRVLTYLSEGYPQDFVNYDNYPLALFCIGDVGLIGKPAVAVVGTRKASKYGKFVTEKLVTSLCENNIAIVSGLATGIDTVAHETTLKMNGKTIAVLGSGFNNIFPKSNYELFKKICETGLVISEYMPNMLPLAYNFPIRNRIIAMLSNAVLMTEAGMKSGALYTINYGIEYGKDIFAVPGNIDSFSSQGCNQILKKCQAGLVTSAEDILPSLKIVSTQTKQEKNIQISFEEQIVLDAISNDELSFDEIVEKVKFDTKTLITLLTTLQINGLIRKSAGNFYSRIFYE